jgi:hypothetical protein
MPKRRGPSSPGSPADTKTPKPGSNPDGRTPVELPTDTRKQSTAKPPKAT